MTIFFMILLALWLVFFGIIFIWTIPSAKKRIERIEADNVAALDQIKGDISKIKEDVKGNESQRQALHELTDEELRLMEEQKQAFINLNNLINNSPYSLNKRRRNNG